MDAARSLDQGHLKRTAVRPGRPRTVEESRIPVPTPAAIGRQAEILLQSLIAFRPRPLRKIIGDRLRGLGDRRESFLGMCAHEAENLCNTGLVHARGDVDKH